MNMRVVAVVVTYNRRELLKRTVECLRQTPGLAGIIIVNNSSTDGTGDWLAEQKDLLVITQPNVGGAGGFCAGMKRAYQEGADWIWCMDDDVFPRPDCLKHMLAYAKDGVGIVSPRRMMDGEIFTTEFQAYNFTNPFGSTYEGKLRKQSVTEALEIQGAAFEGLLISRHLVEKIGYPNKDLFIFYDDTDYCLRAVRAGFKIIYAPDALLDKQKFFDQATWAERNRKKRWKRFYQVRNGAYLNHHYGENFGVRYLRSFINVAGYMAIAATSALCSNSYKLADVARFWRAYRDGIKEQLGILPPLE